MHCDHIGRNHCVAPNTYNSVHPAAATAKLAGPPWPPSERRVLGHHPGQREQRGTRQLEAGCELAGLDSNDEALLRVTLAELRKAKVPHFGAGGSTLGALRFGSTRMRWHGLDMGTIDLDVDLIAYFPTDSARSRFFSGLKARFAADAEFECIPCCGSTTSPSECSAIYWRGKTSADSWGTGAHQTALHHRTDQDQKYYDAHSRLLTNLHHVGRSDRVLDALQVLICIGWLQISSLRPRSTRRILWSTGRHNILYL